MVTKEEVISAYRFLLGREPESPAVVEQFSSVKNWAILRDLFLASREFKAKLGTDAFKPDGFMTRGTEFMAASPGRIDVEISEAQFERLAGHVQKAWEKLGREQPHWSVLTNSRFLPENIGASVQDFYDSGKQTIAYLELAAARAGKSLPDDWTCFELGCGVGRVTAPLSGRFRKVIGCDISAPHLEVARQHLEAAGISNVELLQLQSPRTLRDLPPFDLLYSTIVLQHNPPPLIHHMLRGLLARIRPGGCAYFQVPVARPGYRFVLNDYLAATETGEAGMEMHVLPQEHVFRLLHENGFRLLDIQNDNWTGGHFQSMVFFAEKTGLAGKPAAKPAMDTGEFRIPQDLTVNRTQLGRVLLVGGCIANGWKRVGEDSGICKRVDYVLFNHVANLPENPPSPVTDYDFQLVALPFRSVLPERAYMRLDYEDVEAHEALFREAEGRLFMLLDAAMRWNRQSGLTTFVANFLLPQQNAMGRLLPRFDLRNPVYFVEQLNRRLAEKLAEYPNSHYFDLDQIAASLGRRHVQEDTLCVTSHNAILSDWDWDLDRERLQKPARKPSEIYDLKAGQFLKSVWTQLRADHRALRQEDSVKLVITDLDDTLWRGVVNDLDKLSGNETEGWPGGYAEALSYLRKRGIVLAIVSKNEESRVRALWPKLLHHRLSLDDFAFVKINWKTKVENIGAILGAANLLPRNVVFIDDNPVERESVRAAFPGIRVLGDDPYQIKRVLLWSSETQVATVTGESARRTEMMKNQDRREALRGTMPREEFLQSLNVAVRLQAVGAASDPCFPRIFELLNKTNQFNTTGRRWTREELLGALAAGTRLFCFFVEDKFSDYGLVGVILVTGGHVDQYVMSCRVLGMDVELAALDQVMAELSAAGHETVTARVIETETNFPVRDLFSRAGFERQDGQWRKAPARGNPAPAHVRVTWQGRAERATHSV